MSQVQLSHTLTIVNLCLEDLMGNIWDGVAEKNVQKMAPKATNIQSDHTVQSFVYQSFTQKYKVKEGFRKDRDPIPATIDNFGSGTIQQQPRPERKMSKQLQQSLFGEKSRSIVSEISKKSGVSGNLKSIKSKQNTEEKSKKQSFFISLGYVEEPQDQNIEKIRKRQIQGIEDEQRSKRMLFERAERNKLNALAQEKILKDKGDLTFDYEGLCYGVKPSKIQNQTVQTMRQFFRQPEVKGKERIRVEPTNVHNQKMQSREELQTNKSVFSKDKPEFSEKSFSLAEVLGDPSKISEGVKITELRTNKDNLILQNKTKKIDGVKQYRLKDYKSVTKEKSFVEFSRTTSKKNSMYELSLTPSNIKQSEDKKAQTFRPVPPRSRGQSQQQLRAVQTNTVLENVLGRGLPFIRTKGLRFYDIGISNNTFKTLQPNSTSRKSSKSKSSRIKIDDCELFENTILH